MAQDRIFGRTWKQIDAMQRKLPGASRAIQLNVPGDYGADPIGDGMFRMVPSGDIVDYAERCRRLASRELVSKNATNRRRNRFDVALMDN